MPNDPDVSLPRARTADLPPPDIKRWTLPRKAAVVEAVCSGVTTIEEVCHRYDLTVEEFLSWHNTMERHGVPGLHITKLQKYRYSRPKKGWDGAASLPVQSTSFEVPVGPLVVANEMSAAFGMRGYTRNRQSTMRTGDLVIDLETRGVSVHDKPVRLTDNEYCIFELLSLRSGGIVTKQMLLDHLYGGVDPPKLKIIDVFVCHLRKKLTQATDGKHYIETVWGRGYRLRDPGQAIATAVPPIGGASGSQ